MCEIKKNFVTYDLVHSLRCNPRGSRMKHDMKPTKFWPGARFICICPDADLNTAAYCLAELMHEPFQPFPAATVVVHKSIREEFIARLRSRFRQLKPHVANHPNFERTMETLKFSSRPVKYLIADEADAPPCASPILALDITHLFFPSGADGVTTLHSFDTMEDVATIFGFEQPKFDVIFLFHEGIRQVYKLAALVECHQFFVNCMDACLLEIMCYYLDKRPMVVFKRGYHYECIQINEKWKIIVFPYSSTIARPCCCPTGQCRCYITQSACCEDHLHT
ncbi:hypothetical protein KR018_001194 [Drosophila ironensis]|nr:hypothetical protein KR018_001194 [Drosophila ironensis]